MRLQFLPQVRLLAKRFVSVEILVQFLRWAIQQVLHRPRRATLARAVGALDPDAVLVVVRRAGEHSLHPLEEPHHRLMGECVLPLCAARDRMLVNDGKVVLVDLEVVFVVVFDVVVVEVFMVVLVVVVVVAGCLFSSPT